MYLQCDWLLLTCVCLHTQASAAALKDCQKELNRAEAEAGSLKKTHGLAEAANAEVTCHVQQLFANGEGAAGQILLVNMLQN